MISQKAQFLGPLRKALLRNSTAEGRSPVAKQKQLPKKEHKQVPQRGKESNRIVQNQENIDTPDG